MWQFSSGPLNIKDSDDIAVIFPPVSPSRGYQHSDDLSYATFSITCGFDYSISLTASWMLCRIVPAAHEL